MQITVVVKPWHQEQSLPVELHPVRNKEVIVGAELDFPVSFLFSRPGSLLMGQY